MLKSLAIQTLSLICGAIFVLNPGSASGQAPNFVNDPFAETSVVPGQEVVATLVSEASAVLPGETFTVAVKMVHSGPWHTYWENPGTGQATKLAWELPEGFTAGPIQWPVPEAKKDIIGTSNIYGGTVYLLTDIEVADDVSVGDTADVKVNASWLQCDELCTPGKASLSLKLPVVANASAGKADATLQAAFDEVRARQPVASDAVAITVEDKGETVDIKITPSAADADPGKVHVFHLAKGILTEPSAPAEKQGDSYVVTFEKEDDAGDVAGLEGFAFAENSWEGKGAVFSVSLPEAGMSQPAATSSESNNGTGAAAVAINIPTTVTPAEQTALDEVVSWGLVKLGEEAGASAATNEDDKEPLLLILGFAFIGGLILNLMPCVFPVLGIKIMGFVSQAGEDSKRIKMHGIAFGAGVLISMWALVITLLAVRYFTSDTIIWGKQLQQPWFVFAMVAVIFSFGLSLAGLFEFGTSLTTAGGQLQNKKGYSGSFFSGLLTVLIASPCTGPFMAPAISVALEQNAATSLLIFTTLGLGLASPYILLSFFPALIQKLPRPGAWMETFKQFMAFPMFATVVWLVWLFGKQVGVAGIVGLMIAMLCLAFGLWVYGRFGTPFKKPGIRWSARFALLFAFLGSVLVVRNSIDSYQKVPVTSALITAHGMQWEPLTLTSLVEHRKKGRTVFIDFTADW